jgi:tetratricopeptide (TPR) repeat protein
MIETNANSSDTSLVAKGRAFLERGDISSAVECYGQAYDPETVDESEARSMLIEARSHLLRKHFLEALECFEEALLMGTDVQRRQALDGIRTVGEMRGRFPGLAQEIRKGLEAHLGSRSPESCGIALLSDDENVLLIADEVMPRLPAVLSRSPRMSRLPQHLLDHALPFATRQCIPYADDEDVRYIVEVIAALAAPMEQEHAGD